MKTFVAILIFLVFVAGVVTGALAVYTSMYAPVPEIGLQKAQGCIVDGYIKHADGTVTNNWVCVDPTDDSFEAPSGKQVPFRNYEQKAVYETSE